MWFPLHLRSFFFGVGGGVAIRRIIVFLGLYWVSLFREITISVI